MWPFKIDRHPESNVDMFSPAEPPRPPKPEDVDRWYVCERTDGKFELHHELKKWEWDTDYDFDPGQWRNIYASRWCFYNSLIDVFDTLEKATAWADKVRSGKHITDLP